MQRSCRSGINAVATHDQAASAAATILQSIPAPAWSFAGAVIGAVSGLIGALVGVWISNSSNNRRLEQQLKHDIQEKSKDRTFALRREIYLAAVAELTEINSLLGQLATFDPTKPEVMNSRLTEFLKALSKVSLVSEEETREKVIVLNAKYSKLFVELLADAGAAYKLKIDMNVNRDSYQTLHCERTRILAAMRDFNENTQTKYRFEVLSRAAESIGERVDELSLEFSDLGKMYNAAVSGYAMSTVNKVAALNDLRAEVHSSLSHELGISVDAERLKVIVREQSREANEALQSMLASAVKAYEDEH